MALPLLDYKPTTQNQRVSSFGSADQNEDTPYIYRTEDTFSPTEVEALIKATYRQLFSEHETLKFNRQITVETRFKNGSLTVRDFVRELAKSERFYNLVVEPNNNYRLVELFLKRLLGRAPYNKDEEIAWSIKIGTVGWHGLVDALIDSDEYNNAFGDNTVPYQRKRMEGRPFNLVTPRYDQYYREQAGLTKNDWRFTLDKFARGVYREQQIPEGDPCKYRSMAAAVTPKYNYQKKTSAFDIDYLSKVPVRR